MCRLLNMFYWCSILLTTMSLLSACEDSSSPSQERDLMSVKSDSSLEQNMIDHTIDGSLFDANQLDLGRLDQMIEDTTPSCRPEERLECASPLHPWICSDDGTLQIGEPCPSPMRCIEGSCQAITCLNDSGCSHDTFCLEGECVAYPHPQRGTFNELCSLALTGPAFSPEIQCEWTAGEVSGMPIVIDLDHDGVPEVLVVSGGNVIALSGETCTEVARSNGQFFSGESSLAAGDIDADGEVEVVAMGGFGSIVALSHQLTPKWSAFTRVLGIASAPAIADLDGDGMPEVIAGGVALNGEDGTVHAQSIQEPIAHGFGPIPVVADVDGDGTQEVLYGNRTFNAQLEDITPDEQRRLTPGHVAVAQFDLMTPEPELAVVSGTSHIRVQRLSGEVIFGPYQVPDSLWAGGAPNIADFDGDGLPEIGTAGSNHFAVFDFECLGDPLPAHCAAEGIRWMKSSNDTSSGSTGSTTFDFDGDGRVEVVYNDECFLRVYDGTTGEVLLALANTTGTLIEAPIVADVDGDGRSEIIVSSDQGFPCTEPDPHTGINPQQTQGVKVIRDASERWVRSRPIWNQNAYSITHVESDGSIPAQPEANWVRFNNFRQNLQPEGKSHEAPDLTVRGVDSTRTSCAGVTLSAIISNRGAQMVSGDVGFRFYLVANESRPQTIICEGETATRLAPGESVEVNCFWSSPLNEGTFVWVEVDPPNNSELPLGGRAECVESNNISVAYVPSCHSSGDSFLPTGDESN